MEAILARGGANHQVTKLNFSSKDYVIIVDSIKTPILEVHPYQAEFTVNSINIIHSMFQDHISRRYTQRSAQKFKSITPTYLVLITSNQISSTTLILTFFGAGLIFYTIFGALYFF
jgi:hypothetical protein